MSFHILIIIISLLGSFISSQNSHKCNSQNLSNDKYSNSIIWKQYSISSDGNIPHIIIDQREKSEDIINLDQIPYISSNESEQSKIYSVIPPHSTEVQFRDIHQSSQISGYQMKQMFDDGFYAIAIILSQQNNKHFYTPSPYFSIICHPEKIQYITNDTTVPELTSIKYRLNVDESIFLHPIVQEKCIGKKDMHYITCPKKCDNMKDLCVLAQGIKIGELKYLNKEIIQKTLLRIGPIQLINSELGGYNFKKGIVIYGWNEHIDKLTNKSHEYWNIAYHDSFSQKIETKYHNSILTDQNLSAEKIIAYKVIGKPNLKTCIREDLEVIKLNIKNYIIDLLQESIPWIGLVITLSFAVWFYKIGNTKLKLKQKRKREYEIQRLQKEWGKQQKFDIRRQLKKKEQEQYKTPKPEIPIHYTPEQLLQRKLQAEYKEKEQLRINAEQEKDRRRNEEEKRRRDEEERRRDKEEKLQKEYEYNKEMEELNSYYNSKQDDIRKQYHINSYSYEENRSREESDLNQLNRTYDNCYHDINHKYDKDICIIQ